MVWLRLIKLQNLPELGNMEIELMIIAVKDMIQLLYIA